MMSDGKYLPWSGQYCAHANLCVELTAAPGTIAIRLLTLPNHSTVEPCAESVRERSFEPPPGLDRVGARRAAAEEAQRPDCQIFQHWQFTGISRLLFGYRDL